MLSSVVKKLEKHPDLEFFIQVFVISTMARAYGPEKKPATRSNPWVDLAAFLWVSPMSTRDTPQRVN
jgi:hypothetical protein